MIISRLLTNINFPCHYKGDGRGILEQFRIPIGKLATPSFLLSFQNNTLKMPVLLSLQFSKTNITLIWRFFFGKIERTGSRFTLRKWNYYVPLSAKGSNRLEDIHYTFVLHSFQNDTQCDENAGSTHAGTTVNCDWTLLTKLFLGLVNLSNEVNESFARLRNTWKSK
jgi:hypothetical protein